MDDLKAKLEKILADATHEIRSADTHELQEIEVRVLGRKGQMNEVLAALPSLSGEERGVVGKLGNEVKEKITAEIGVRRHTLASESEKELAHKEWIDVTEPGAATPVGHKHPSTAAIEDIVSLFERIGFRRARYAEADWDTYAFEALNMPKEHPARDEWETFFLDIPPHQKLGKAVLTPHTSNSQPHEMARRKPPIRMVSIGKTYRRQSDVTHLPMFHQFEGLVIDKGIALTHLRGVLDYFFKNYFGPDRKFRLRPFHFMFTEPSFEIDISCGRCGGTGMVDGATCRLCKSGWLELGGAGMVHPNVLKAGGIDPKVYSGFAFGWGLERTYLMRAGMNVGDIRTVYGSDLRFVQQF